MNLNRRPIDVQSTTLTEDAREDCANRWEHLHWARLLPLEICSVSPGVTGDVEVTYTLQLP